MRKIFLMILLGVVSSSAVAESTDADVSASGNTITAKHRYTMGDNDSKADAINLCFLQAKRKAIEYAGVYVESSTEISQTSTSNNAKSNMKTIAKALVSSEMVSSTTGFDNGRVFIDCVVNAKVDLNTVKQEVEKIAADPVAKKQIEQQQIALKRLEDDIAKIQARMESASSKQAVSLRQERTAVFKEIDKLQQRKLEIISVLETKGNKAKELVSEGMNSKEVLELIGEPRVETTCYLEKEKTAWNYGTEAANDRGYRAEVWVNFKHGIVKGVNPYQQECYGRYEEKKSR